MCGVETFIESAQQDRCPSLLGIDLPARSAESVMPVATNTWGVYGIARGILVKEFMLEYDCCGNSDPTAA